MNEVNADSIIKWMTEMVEKKHPIDSMTWMDAARKLSLFLGDEKDKQFELEQIVAKKHVEVKDNLPDMPVSEVKMRIEAMDEYKTMRQQKAKVEQILEFIKVSKLYARLSQEEWKATL